MIVKPLHRIIINTALWRTVQCIHINIKHAVSDRLVLNLRGSVINLCRACICATLFMEISVSVNLFLCLASENCFIIPFCNYIKHTFVTWHKFSERINDFQECESEKKSRFAYKSLFQLFQTFRRRSAINCAAGENYRLLRGL